MKIMDFQVFNSAMDLWQCENASTCCFTGHGIGLSWPSQVPGGRPTSHEQNIQYWTILQVWVQERKLSHWLTFMLLLALCAPKVLGCNLVSGMVQRWADNPIFSGWVTRASLVFRAEISAFEAMFTMSIRDVTVVHAWDPWVDRRWDRGWGWGNWGVAIKVEGGEAWHVRPPHWHHSAPPRSSRRGGKDMERALRRNQRNAGGRLSKGSLVICCSLSTTSPCSSATVTAATPRSWWQGGCSCCRRRRWWWRLKLKLDGGLAPKRREHQGGIVAGLHQLFIQDEDLLNLCSHFFSRYLKKVKVGRSSAR